MFKEELFNMQYNVYLLLTIIGAHRVTHNKFTYFALLFINHHEVRFRTWTDVILRSFVMQGRPYGSEGGDKDTTQVCVTPFLTNVFIINFCLFNKADIRS